MSVLSENMRYLRAQLTYSQQKVADDLTITRGRYAKYEEGASDPPVDILICISRYFHVSIDLMVSVDLRRLPLKDILALPDNRILLPITVDTTGANQIELVPHKTKMGYLNGYNDPEYIESLQHISLPFLTKGKYRAFPAGGDSMPPHNEGSIIIGKYVESVQSLKAGRTYVFVTRSEGITYKRLDRLEDDKLHVRADNPFYEPYTIKMDDLFEVWEYACSVSTTEFNPGDFEPNSRAIKEMFVTLRNDIKKLENRIDA